MPVFAVTMKDCSQSGEQQVILDYFRDDALKSRFLDIGAYDGQTFSNTYALAQKGWGGTCVEPNAHAYAKLFDLYCYNNQITLINAIVSTEVHVVSKFFYSSVSGVSTANTDHKKVWEKSVDYRETWVGAISVEALCAIAGPCEFISIDAEGQSGFIAASMLIDEFIHPELWCIEMDSNREGIAHLLKKRGYKMIKATANNEIWGLR